MSSGNRRSKYKLFISHSWSYSDEYKRMESLLEDASYFDFENYSVPQKDAIEGSVDYKLKHHQIKPASVVIVLAGIYSSHSEMIKKEVRMAEDLDKPILGVEPYGSERTSKYVRNKADEVVGWNTKSVVDAIRDLSP